MSETDKENETFVKELIKSNYESYVQYLINNYNILVKESTKSIKESQKIIRQLRHLNKGAIKNIVLYGKKLEDIDAQLKKQFDTKIVGDILRAIWKQMLTDAKFQLTWTTSSLKKYKEEISSEIKKREWNSKILEQLLKLGVQEVERWN